MNLEIDNRTEFETAPIERLVNVALRLVHCDVWPTLANPAYIVVENSLVTIEPWGRYERATYAQWESGVLQLRLPRLAGAYTALRVVISVMEPTAPGTGVMSNPQLPTLTSLPRERYMMRRRARVSLEKDIILRRTVLEEIGVTSCGRLPRRRRDGAGAQRQRSARLGPARAPSPPGAPSAREES